MRLRERLEDFRGGHVACRTCKRLLYFDPEALRSGEDYAMVCCNIAYALERQRIDLAIFDRLEAGEFADAQTREAESPIPIFPTGDPVIDPSIPEPEEGADVDEDELAVMVVSDATATERRAERVATLKPRQGR